MKEELRMPVIYVTHDVNEALYLADDLLPIVGGAGWTGNGCSAQLRGGWDLARSERAKAVREPHLSLAY